jgi:hypothetical protein
MAANYALTLLNSETVTTTGASPSQLVPQGYNRWIAQVSVGTVTGSTPSLTVTFEHSYDGANWTTLIAMTAITASSAQEVKFAAAATDYLKPLMSYVRVSYAVSGTGSPTFNTTYARLLLDK